MKKEIFKRLRLWVLIALLCIGEIACASGVQNSQSEYDALQQVFLSLNQDTTIEDLNSLIDANGLESTSQDYNGTPKTTKVKIASTHNVALQKYAESGDYIEVTFDESSGAFMVADYLNQSTFKMAIYYNYGTYWDFNEKEPNNRYSGYYFRKSGNNKGGITIKYSNGKTAETGYFKCADGEEAIANAVNGN